MPGTKDGGLKAAAKVKERFGNNWYKEIGSIGGRNGHTGGFAVNRELARVVGAIGGSRSKKGNHGVETLGVRGYFDKYSPRLNGVTADEFIGMYRLGMSHAKIGKQIGRSASLVGIIVRQGKKEGVL